MINLPGEDEIAMGIFSGLFIAGGAVLRVMGMGFYWIVIAIGFILGAAVLLSKFWGKHRRRNI